MGNAIERILIELSLDIRRYKGSKEASGLDAALKGVLPEVDRALRCALTMVYLQGCADTASVSDHLIAGAETRACRATDGSASSVQQYRDIVVARFHRLAAGFGHVEAETI